MRKRLLLCIVRTKNQNILISINDKLGRFIMATNKIAIKREDQKLIYLKWHDAHASGGWYTPKATTEFLNSEICIIEQVGWVLYEDKKEIVLCARRLAWDKKTIPDEHEFGMLQKIPIGWILKRKILDTVLYMKRELIQSYCDEIKHEFE